MQQTQLKITLDRLEDPEKITSYKIVNNSSNILLAKGHYFFLFGFRLGIHLDSETCRMTKSIKRCEDLK